MYEASENLKSLLAERARRFERHFAAADAVSLVSDYYVPDNLQPLVSPGDHAVIGRQALISLFEGLFTQFSSVRQVPLTIRADVDLAYEVSNAYLQSRNEEAEVTFRYLATWRRCEDTWRVEADFFAPGRV